MLTGLLFGVSPGIRLGARVLLVVLNIVEFLVNVRRAFGIIFCWPVIAIAWADKESANELRGLPIMIWGARVSALFGVIDLFAALYCVDTADQPFYAVIVALPYLAIGLVAWLVSMKE